MNYSLNYDIINSNKIPVVEKSESTYKSYFRDVYTAFGMSADDNIKIIAHKLKAGYIPNKSIRTFMPKSNGLNRMYTFIHRRSNSLSGIC